MPQPAFSTLAYALCLFLAIVVLRLHPKARPRGMVGASFLGLLMLVPQDAEWVRNPPAAMKLFLCVAVVTAVFALRPYREDGW